MTQLTTNELLTLLGQKEAENYALRRDLAQVLEELNAAREALAPVAQAESAEQKENN